MRPLRPEKREIEFIRYDNGEVDIDIVWPDGYREALPELADSPFQFDWGNYSRGAKTCARAILLDLVETDEFAGKFMVNFIAKIPREGGELDVSVILSWLAMKEQHYELSLGV
jgi:hypothetical protein